MKRLNLTSLIVLLGTPLAFPAGLISKQTAENDALKAVGGGTVQQATLDSMGGKRIWSVDIAGSTSEHEVGVDAHTGANLKIITQPSSSTALSSKAQAEQDAQVAVGGGGVLQAVLDTSGKNDRRMWSVDIADSTREYEVSVDAHTSAIVKIVTQPLEAMAPCTFITKAKAENIALAAVRGGKIISTVLEKNDNPVDWSVDIQHSDGQDYEVKVDACSGKGLQIIVGG